MVNVQRSALILSMGRPPRWIIQITSLPGIFADCYSQRMKKDCSTAPDRPGHCVTRASAGFFLLFASEPSVAETGLCAEKNSPLKCQAGHLKRQNPSLPASPKTMSQSDFGARSQNVGDRPSSSSCAKSPGPPCAGRSWSGAFCT
jgi:hypothetical protein